MTDHTHPEDQPIPESTPAAAPETMPGEPTAGEALETAPSYQVIHTPAVSSKAAEPPTSTPVGAAVVAAEAVAGEPTVGEALQTAPSYQVVNVPAVSGEAEAAAEPDENFADVLAAYEKTHKHKTQAGPTLSGTVVSLSADQVFLDVGYKIEGVLPRSAFANNAEGVRPGEAFP